jgi:hypothetical protein
MKAKRPNFPPTRELELPRNLSFPWPLAEPSRISRLPIQLPLATGGRRVANVGEAQRWGRELLAANRRVDDTVERRAAAAPPSPALPAPSPVAPTLAPLFTVCMHVHSFVGRWTTRLRALCEGIDGERWIYCYGFSNNVVKPHILLATHGQYEK